MRLGNGAMAKGTRFQRGTCICPVCHADGLIRGGERETELVRTLWVHCSNVTCGMTWRVQLSFVHVISPSGIPGGGANLPQAPAHLKRIIHPPPGAEETDPNQLTMFGSDDEEDEDEEPAAQAA